MDRGRGRGRGSSSYHSPLGFVRSSSLYDEDLRGGGGGGLGSRVSWNGTVESDSTGWKISGGGGGGLSGSGTSPRKDFLSRSSTLENWRKGSRVEEESSGGGGGMTGSGEAWRGIGSTTTGYNSKWCKCGALLF